MAFKGGTTVQPGLGRLDFSGFEDAAKIEAESMARIGASISGAIKQFQAKKEEREANEAYDRMMMGFSKGDNPIGQALRDMGLDDPQLVAASRKGLGKREILPIVNMFAKLGVEQEFNKAKIANEQARIAAQGNETIEQAKPTLDEMEDFKKYIKTMGGGGIFNKDLTLKNGRLYDADFIGADDFIPESDPIVQELMNLEGVREKFLFGYGDPTLVETKPNEPPTADTVPVDSFIATDPIKPVGLRLPERTSNQRGFGY